MKELKTLNIYQKLVFNIYQNLVFISIFHVAVDQIYQNIRNKNNFSLPKNNTKLTDFAISYLWNNVL